MNIPIGLLKYQNKPCKACGEGFLKVEKEFANLTYLEVYKIQVPSWFVRCVVCGASILTKETRELLSENKKKVIERIFYN